VALLWPHLYTLGLEIGFAYQSFKWTNSAKGNAGVICVVIGIRNSSSKIKVLFKNRVSHVVRNINPYLTSGKNLVVKKRSKTLSTIPVMNRGSGPVDGSGCIADNHIIPQQTNRNVFPSF